MHFSRTAGILRTGLRMTPRLLTLLQFLLKTTARNISHCSFPQMSRTVPKHLTLNRPPRLGGKVVAKIMVRVTDSAATGESSSEVRYAYEIIDAAGKSYDALALARQAVNVWETLIKMNGGAL